MSALPARPTVMAVSLDRSTVQTQPRDFIVSLADMVLILTYIITPISSEFSPSS